MRLFSIPSGTVYKCITFLVGRLHACLSNTKWEIGFKIPMVTVSRNKLICRIVVFLQLL